MNFFWCVLYADLFDIRLSICIDIDEVQLKWFSLETLFINAFSRQLNRVYKYSLGINSCHCVLLTVTIDLCVQLL